MELVYQDYGLPRTVASPSFDSSSLLLFAIFQRALLHSGGDTSTGPDSPFPQWDALWAVSGVDTAASLYERELFHMFHP
ncbi:hypothetical protein GJ744_011046 [Endocarpon pusillum]|uniref:Uncharacterized protein n=1 Tax=Endocarpon pusillum TaxID=364733 RepID=A0A8H7AHC2_9EURO|nr:hypothetical protein GJ744_011046 [Endocarpon pusillum]